MMNILPGGPEAMFVGENFDLATIASVRQNLGLNEPPALRYIKWVMAALHGDFGRSFRDGQPVLGEILDRLSATVQLSASALILALVVALVTGILSAVRPNSWIDRLSSLIAFLGLSFPSFWLGIMLILIFSQVLGWLPGSGIAEYGRESDILLRIRHAILPTITLASVQMAAFMRYTRSAMLDVLRDDYIRTAQSKGLGQRTILLRHAFRNALIPVVTAVGLALPNLVGGAVIVETVFSWPGLGRLAVDAVFQRDYPLVMGVEMIIALFIVMANLATDLIYPIVDPRVTYE
jgi:peptide/nickel transport system permease protein